MDFHRYDLNFREDAYEVVLYIKTSPTLEEFSEEFGGISKHTEEDINRIALGYVRDKFPTLKVHAIKVMMGGILVTTIMLGGVNQVFAQEDNELVTTNTTDNALDFETSIDAPVLEEETLTEVVPKNSVEEVPMNEPGLIPGDFFYFVELVAEKIQLALTFGDTEKAELMTKFANERIAEANILFDEGNTTGAIELLNKALENQELALSYVAEEEVETETALEEEDPIPEELEGITLDGDKGEGEDELAENEETVDNVRNEIQDQFSRNITALLLAMEKVENPKAKEALTKNVEKAFSRMERKLEKMSGLELRLAGIQPITDEVKELRDDIRLDQGDFEEDLKNVEQQEKATDRPDEQVVKAKERSADLPSQAQKGLEKGKEAQQKEQKTKSDVDSKATNQNKPSLNNENKQNNQASKKEKGNNGDLPPSSIAKDKAKGNPNVDLKLSKSPEVKTDSPPKENKGNEKGSNLERRNQ